MNGIDIDKSMNAEMILRVVGLLKKIKRWGVDNPPPIEHCVKILFYFRAFYAECLGWVGGGGEHEYIK